MINALRLTTILGLTSLAYAQSMQSSESRLTVELGRGFESKFAQLNGTQLHYVRGGSGPALILLHGFPEDWYEFRLVMPGSRTGSQWLLWTSAAWATLRR